MWVLQTGFPAWVDGDEPPRLWLNPGGVRVAAVLTRGVKNCSVLSGKTNSHLFPAKFLSVYLPINLQLFYLIEAHPNFKSSRAQWGKQEQPGQPTCSSARLQEFSTVCLKAGLLCALKLNLLSAVPAS